MNEENILKIESDCKIIKPIIQKKYNNNLLQYKTQKSSKFCKSKKFFKNDLSLNEEDKNNIIDLIGYMNRSMELDLDNEEKKEEFWINSQKRNEKYSILEILAILNQPIIDQCNKNRYILQKEMSDLYEIYENNYNELNLEKIINMQNENLLKNIIYDNKSLINNNSLENEEH